MAHHISKFRAAPYVYKWSKDVEHLLPDHYKKRCLDFMYGQPTPVHWRPDPRKFKADKYGQRIPVQNVPIKVYYPEISNKGLWGGEGVIKGYVKRGDMKPRVPHLWKPCLSKRVLYSEIFNKHFHITVTMRTLDLIDDAYGFDHYILKTPEIDLNSRLGMELKRKMLLALIRKDIPYDDAEKKQTILDKYKEYIIPEEEAEWIGLPASEAVAKAEKLHAERNPPRPLKEIFTEDLVHKLLDKSEEPVEESESLLKKLNIFDSEKKS